MSNMTKDVEMLTEALMNYGEAESRFDMTCANFMVYHSTGKSEDEIVESVAKIGLDLGIEPKRAGELFDEVLIKLQKSMEMLDKLKSENSEEVRSNMSMGDLMHWVQENK